MDEREWLAERFEEYRPRLRALAYRMLGSFSDADDVLQDAWIRISRTDARAVDNVGGWLTTIVARVSLNALRTRRRRREQPLEVYVPDPVVEADPLGDPEHEALLTDSVSLALLVVLDVLSPEERLAFVLHDMFAVPFSEIATMLDRSPDATRQLASRARRQVRGAAPGPDADLSGQRAVVDAFFAAARDGDIDALVAVLDPDVVLRSDAGAARPRDTVMVQGAREVAARAMTFARLSPFVRPALVNGVAGVVVASQERCFSIMAFTVKGGRIVAIDSLADPERLREFDLSAFVH